MRTLINPDFQWVFGSKKRRLYRQSRLDFYEGRNALTSTASFHKILNSNNLDASLSTEKCIKFYGLYFGQSLKETIKKLGKPNYKDKRTLVLKNQVTIYYRLTIKEVKCILQMHFYKDQFFFGKMEIRNSNPSVKRDIGELVCQKYGVNEKDWTGSIFDDDGNKVLIKQNIIPNVCYITGDKTLTAALKMELNLIEQPKKYRRREQTELLLDMV